MGRVLVALGLLVLGAGTGLATVAVHTWWWGLALGLGAAAATLVALPAGWWARLAFAAGFAVMVGWLVPQRPEGDYAIGQDTPGYLVIGAALVVLVAGVATLPGPRSRRVRHETPERAS
ncbi:MAG: DUF6113 family protein [Nocardioides sp.]